MGLTDLFYMLYPTKPAVHIYKVIYKHLQKAEARLKRLSDILLRLSSYSQICSKKRTLALCGTSLSPFGTFWCDSCMWFLYHTA